MVEKGGFAMKKLFTLTLVMMLIPLISHAKQYKNNFMTARVPAGWSVQVSQMPGAGKMVGGTAAQSAGNRFGGIDVTDRYSSHGFASGGDIANQAIDAGIGTATDTATAGISYGVMKGMMKGMPKFAMATFTNQAYPDAQLQLSIVEGAGAAGSGAYSGGSGSGKSSCQTVEDKSIRWGDGNAKVYTTHCPQGKQWVTTTMVTMKRGGAQYMLMGTLPSETKSLDTFNSKLKPGRDQIIASTKLIKSKK
jgi:hypothetical protein